MPTLIAMARSGDVVLTDDGRTVRLHLPEGAGGITAVERSEVDRIISGG